MDLLKTQDRTREELRNRLLQADFLPEAVEEALSYVESYGYVNDEAYAKRYVEYHADRQSRRKMEQVLLQKGIDKELVESAVQEAPPEEIALRRQMEKYLQGSSLPLAKVQEEKLFSHFFHQEYGISDIYRVYQELMQAVIDGNGEESGEVS